MADRSYEWPSDATTGSAAQAGQAWRRYASDASGWRGRRRRHTSHLVHRNRADKLVGQLKWAQPKRLAPLLPLRVAVDLPQPPLRAFNDGRVHLHRRRQRECALQRRHVRALLLRRLQLR